MIEAICDYCGKSMQKSTGHYNRAIKLGAGIYCDRKCAGLGRRIEETPEEKREIKSWYDLFIRTSRKEDEYWLNYLQTAFSFHFDYAANPDKYKRIRKEKQASHNEYCRQPKYKEWKKGYDEQYRAKKNYGDWWEAAIALKNLDKEIDYRESKRQNKIYNKSTTKRKRAWQKHLKEKLNNFQQLI